jgi:hypothetical protein
MKQISKTSRNVSKKLAKQLRETPQPESAKGVWCRACQRYVPSDGQEPFPEHRSDCDWVTAHRLLVEPIVWKLEIGSFRVRCRLAKPVPKAGKRYFVESQTSLGYKLVGNGYLTPQEAMSVVMMAIPACELFSPIILDAIKLSLEKLDKK